MANGDLAICYASVWQAVFAVVEVTSHPEEDPERDRWRWSFGIRPLLALDDLDRSVPAEEVGIFPSSIWRHSLHPPERGAVRGRALRSRQGELVTDRHKRRLDGVVVRERVS